MRLGFLNNFVQCCQTNKIRQRVSPAIEKTANKLLLVSCLLLWFFYIFLSLRELNLFLLRTLWTYFPCLFSSRTHFSLRKILQRSVVFPSSLSGSLAQPGPPVILIFPTWLLLFSWRRKKNIFINLLQPTCYVMHQQFNIQQLYVLPTLYLCVLYLSENKQRLVPLTA